MAIPRSLTNLNGIYRGSNILYRPWLNPPDTSSDAGAAVTRIANGRFLSIAYTWADGAEPHEGVLLLGHNPEDEALSASWVDSWHQSATIMHCRGQAVDGTIRVEGRYPAPPDPDWGWRIELRAGSRDTFDIVMTNIAATGEEMVAVRASFTRV